MLELLNNIVEQSDLGILCAVLVGNSTKPASEAIEVLLRDLGQILALGQLGDVSNEGLSFGKQPGILGELFTLLGGCNTRDTGNLAIASILLGISR